MSEDMTFSVQEAVLSNLERLSKEQSIISDQRLLELCDAVIPVADASVGLLEDGLSSYDVLSVISEGLSFGEYRLSDYTTPEHRVLLAKDARAICLADRALFTELYVKELAKRGHPFSEKDFLPGSPCTETFTYVRNSFSDEAFDVFSQDFVDPRVKYSSSFKDAARLVSSGEVTYSLFPLEEKGGARLPTVSEIIFRNDFKINKLFDIFECDLSNITDERIACAAVIHKCNLTVNARGIEGAAVTAMIKAGAAGPGEYEEVYHDYIVDRAFGFVLTDSYGTVLFSGVVNTAE